MAFTSTRINTLGELRSKLREANVLEEEMKALTKVWLNESYSDQLRETARQSLKEKYEQLKMMDTILII